MKKAIFLTLDNTLITTISGRQYPLHGEDWKLIPKTVDILRSFCVKDYMLFIIINQKQIKEGLVTNKSFHRRVLLIIATLEKVLNIHRGSILYNYCIDKHSYNYLPKPGMIYDLASEYELDIVNSILIGNSDFDKTISIYAGIKQYIDISNLNID